eukprot:GSChrysophyteH1.ASY1.ANO1.471.1 assembled CDS
MVDAKEALKMEQAFHVHCSAIMSPKSDWEAKNHAVLALISRINDYKKRELDPSVVQDMFGMNIFRLLKEPLKVMIGDLRSQQVRDTCYLLTALSELLGDHMRHFLRDFFHFILDGVKVSNKVMSGFVDECIISLIRNTTFKMAIPLIITELSCSKAKLYRERCLDYVNEILVSWDITERDADLLIEGIRLGLEDASMRGREIARLAYLNLFQLFPKKTEKLKQSITSKTLQARLLKEETEFLFLERERKRIEEEETQAADCMPSQGVFSRMSILGSIQEGAQNAHAPAVSVSGHVLGSLGSRGNGARFSFAAVNEEDADVASNPFAAVASSGAIGANTASISVADTGERSASPRALTSSPGTTIMNTEALLGNIVIGKGTSSSRLSIRDSYLASLHAKETAATANLSVPPCPLDSDVEYVGSNSINHYNPDKNILQAKMGDTDTALPVQSQVMDGNGFFEPLALRARRESIQDTGAAMIQAVVRGKLARKSLLTVVPSTVTDDIPMTNGVPDRSIKAKENSVNGKENSVNTYLPNNAKSRGEAHESPASMATVKKSQQRTSIIRTAHTPGMRYGSTNASSGTSSAAVMGGSSRKAFMSPTDDPAHKRRVEAATGAPKSAQHAPCVSSKSADSSHSAPMTIEAPRRRGPATARKAGGGAGHTTAKKQRAATVAKIVDAIADTPQQSLTLEMKSELADLLKLKISRTFGVVKKELAMIRKLELTMSNEQIIPSLMNEDLVYTGIGDGMGIIPTKREMQDVESIKSESKPGNGHATKEDEEFVTNILKISQEHVELCRNFEDRFHTALLDSSRIGSS